MTKIQKLEDLKTWQEARKLAKILEEIIFLLPSKEEYNLKKHLRECKRDIPANIAEGFGRFYYRDIVQFYRVATGSLNEVKSDIYLCLDEKYIPEDLFQKAFDQVEVVYKFLNGLLTSARKIKAVSHK